MNEHKERPAESPGKIAWRRLRRNRVAMAGAAVLVALYTLAIFAGFFSPYSPTEDEFRDHFFHPPSTLHFRDPAGHFSFRPWVSGTYLADKNAINYAAGSPASVCYRRSSANANPYLADSLESDAPVLTIRDDNNHELVSLYSLQETDANSGLFCGILSLDAEKLETKHTLRVVSAFGDSATFSVTGERAPADEAAASGTIFLRNEHGRPASSYSRRVERYPVLFLVRGRPYNILWLFQSDLHLFGAPEPAHVFLLGTDQSGRDQFSRLLFGAQISLTVGLFAVLLTTIFGLLIGGIAGYYGGILDTAAMRFAEIVLAIPGLYLILTIRNMIPDRLQESYDKMQTLLDETYAWQENPAALIAVALIVILSSTYYCYRKHWGTPALVGAALIVTVTIFGLQLFEAVLAIVQYALPGTIHLTSQWTYLVIIVILSFVGWAAMARVIRGMVYSLKQSEYVLAAQALGAGDMRVILRHILPNTLGYVIVRATLTIPAYILAEIGLSFLSLGVQEPIPSWGNMLTQAESLRVLTQFTWTLAPGFFIFLTVLAYNILGDGLRDAFDPRG